MVFVLPGFIYEEVPQVLHQQDRVFGVRYPGVCRPLKSVLFRMELRSVDRQSFVFHQGDILRPKLVIVHCQQVVVLVERTVRRCDLVWSDAVGVGVVDQLFSLYSLVEIAVQILQHP